MLYSVVTVQCQHGTCVVAMHYQCSIGVVPSAVPAQHHHSIWPAPVQHQDSSIAPDFAAPLAHPRRHLLFEAVGPRSAPKAHSLQEPQAHAGDAGRVGRHLEDADVRELLARRLERRGDAQRAEVREPSEVHHQRGDASGGAGASLGIASVKGVAMTDPKLQHARPRTAAG